MGFFKLFAYVSLLPLVLTQIHDALKGVFLYIHAIGFAYLIYDTLSLVVSKPQKSKGRKEMYGLRHTLLNLQFPPPTLWFNMGLWVGNTSLFSEACENAVSKVIQNSNIQAGESVLDVGFGCGDSCKYLADKIKCRVTGVTNELSQITVANEMLTVEQKERIQLLHGSADRLEDVIRPSSERFDHVISIDSAYHYNTRWDFFNSAYHQLKDDGGTLGLFDFACHPNLLETFKTSPWKLRMFKIVCKLLKVPPANLLATPDEYIQKLFDAGFKEAELETVPPEHVFGGISRLIDQQLHNASKYGININLSDKLSLAVTGMAFKSLAKNEWVLPVFAFAKKGKDA